MKQTTDNPKQVVEFICKQILKILQNKKQVVMAVPGGRSVQPIFSEFLTHTEMPWEKIHIFMVDERLVPISDKESNFYLVKKQFADNLVRKKMLSEKNLHPFILDNSKKDLGIKKYENELKKYGGTFDVVILGAGEDCHVAGLFPDYTIKDNSDYFIYFHNSPKPPKDRMTASKKLIQNSKFGVVIFLGEGKKKAYENFKNKKLKLDKCPAKLVKKIKNYIVYTDLE